MFKGTLISSNKVWQWQLILSERNLKTYDGKYVSFPLGRLILYNFSTYVRIVWLRFWQKWNSWIFVECALRFCWASPFYTHSISGHLLYSVAQTDFIWQIPMHVCRILLPKDHLRMPSINLLYWSIQIKRFFFHCLFLNYSFSGQEHTCRVMTRNCSVVSFLSMLSQN